MNNNRYKGSKLLTQYRALSWDRSWILRLFPFWGNTKWSGILSTPLWVWAFPEVTLVKYLRYSSKRNVCFLRGVTLGLSGARKRDCSLLWKFPFLGISFAIPRFAPVLLNFLILLNFQIIIFDMYLYYYWRKLLDASPSEMCSKLSTSSCFLSSKKELFPSLLRKFFPLILSPFWGIICLFMFIAHISGCRRCARRWGRSQFELFDLAVDEPTFTVFFRPYFRSFFVLLFHYHINNS